MLAFKALAERFMAACLTRHPVSATYLGVAGHDGELPDLGEAAFGQWARDVAGWQEAVTALPVDALSKDEQIDRELLLCALAREEIAADFAAWRRSPEPYGKAADGVLALFLMPAADEGARVTSVHSRFKQIPDLLEQGMTNLQPESASRLLVERELKAARANAQFLGELLPQPVEDGQLAWKLQTAAGQAAEASLRFARFLEGLSPKARGDFAFGEGRYTDLLCRAELLATTPVQLALRAKTVSDELGCELEKNERILKDGYRDAGEGPGDPQ